jgi:hypothetical protein
MKKNLHILIFLSCFGLFKAGAVEDPKTLLEDPEMIHLMESYPITALEPAGEIVVVAPISILVIIKEGIKKVIRAMDLVVLRLQKQFLRLQLVMEKLRNSMSKLKLKEINDFVKEKKEIFDKYYNELWTLKGKIDEIKAIKEAVQSQATLIANFNKVFNLFKGDSYLDQKELDMIYEVYSGMLQKNLDHITTLQILITDYQVQMEDGERLELIQETIGKMTKVAVDFQGFTGKIKRVSLSRAAKENEVDLMKSYYSL